VKISNSIDPVVLSEFDHFQKFLFRNHPNAEFFRFFEFTPGVGAGEDEGGFA